MFRLTLGSFIALLLAAPCIAQETEVQESPAEGSFTESRTVIAATDDGSGAPPQVFAFSTNGDSVGMGEMVVVGDSPMMGAPDIFSLANNTSVQREIELVDEQMDQIREINSEFGKKIQEEISGMRLGNMDPDRGRNLSELIQRLNDEKRSRMQEVLLPHQFDRLRQIALQTQMKRSGEAATLGSDKVAEELGITPEQQEKIKARADELKKEMEQKIAQLKEEMRDELLDELTRDQREKLEEMMGDSFELQTPSFRDRIQRMQDRRQQKQESDDN